MCEFHGPEEIEREENERGGKREKKVVGREIEREMEKERQT